MSTLRSSLFCSISRQSYFCSDIQWCCVIMNNKLNLCLQIRFVKKIEALIRNMLLHFAWIDNCIYWLKTKIKLIVQAFPVKKIWLWIQSRWTRVWHCSVNFLNRFFFCCLQCLKSSLFNAYFGIANVVLSVNK